MLRNRLEFFGAADWITTRPVIAWSAGAMALSERVILFHDRTTYGVGLAEVLDRGLGLLPGVVFLPHAHQRLALEDVENVAILAHRFAPRTTIGLENGAVLHFTGTTIQSVGAPDAALVLGRDGTLVPLLEAHAVAP